MRLLIAFVLAAGLFHASPDTVSTSVSAAIDAGNQASIDGVKSGNIKLIAATYADSAVDCGPTGECVKGRPQIERHLATELAVLGRAHSAGVRTWGSSQHGDYVYEWGQAEAEFAGGKRLVDKYLTVWQKQSDGSWKIFRNIVIPGE